MDPEIISTLLVTQRVTLGMLNSIKVINEFSLALLILAHLQSSLSETFKEYLIMLKSVLVHWDWSVRLVHPMYPTSIWLKTICSPSFVQTMGPGG